MGQRQGRVGGAQGGEVLPREPGFLEGLGVAVVVPEDEHSPAGAVAGVEHQAPIAPGVRVGDVAQADDGVAGPHPAAPFAEQVVVHLLDVSERPLPAEQDGAVGQVQVGPDPGSLGRRLKDRDRRLLHRPGQVSLGARAIVRGPLKLEFGFPQVPHGLDVRGR